MSAIYPVTPNLGLTTTGMNEVLAVDMTLIDEYCNSLAEQIAELPSLSGEIILDGGEF